ncbi:MAG: alpha/beta hydrolase-fold protein, partial [Nakamurella sp.]
EDPLPTVVLLAAGALGAALALAVLRPVRWPVRLACVLAVACVGISGVGAINQYYGQYPTLRAALGANPDNQVDFGRNFVAPDQLVSAPDGTPLQTVWTPPPGMPPTGSLAEVSIPGTSSGFQARNAWVYLPPAYLTTPRAELPVVIMMAGQPGSPRDWLDGGKLDEVLDDYAAQHRGLSPVVLTVDNLGNSFDNPACVDSPRGNAFSYLTVDVPNWIKDNLQVVPDTKRWAVGGLSSGGTCALALVVNAPDIYRTFVDISGEDQITVGDPAKTVTELFGGSQEKANAVQPLIVMKTKTFPDTAGFVVAGTDDSTYLPQAKRVVAAATTAGMTIEYVELPGGHEWSVWGLGFAKALPWLAQRMGIE